MTSIHIDVEDATVRQALQGLEAGAGDLKPAFDVVGSYLVASTQARFEAERAPGGAPWRPTLRGGAILRDSARLYGSLTHRATRDSVEAGTNVVYAAVHQFGATIRAKTKPYLRFQVGGRWARKKEVTVPARPFLGLDDDDRTEILAILRGHLAGAAGVAGAAA